MYFEKPLYLVDTNSPLIYAWPSYVFFIGDTKVPLIYEPGSPVKLSIQLPQDADEREDPYLIEKHEIGSRHIQLPLPVLCITNPIYISLVETLLYAAGLFPIIIDDDYFRMDSSFTLGAIQKEKPFRECEPQLMSVPLTMPVDSIGTIPYVDHKFNLIIPQDCPPIWQWWKGGLSPGSVVHCLKNVLSEDIYKKLQKDHPVHEKDKPSKKPTS